MQAELISTQCVCSKIEQIMCVLSKTAHLLTSCALKKTKTSCPPYNVHFEDCFLFFLVLTAPCLSPRRHPLSRPSPSPRSFSGPHFFPLLLLLRHTLKEYSCASDEYYASRPPLPHLSSESQTTLSGGCCNLHSHPAPVPDIPASSASSSLCSPSFLLPWLSNVTPLLCSLPCIRNENLANNAPSLSTLCRSHLIFFSSHDAHVFI